MVEAGDPGFHALARLLEHEDTLVWAEAVTVIDLHFAREDWDDLVPARKARNRTVCDTSSVLAVLRERYPFAHLRYLLLPPYTHGTDWRGSRSLDCDADEHCEVSVDIHPNEQALGFCEDVLMGRVEYPDWTDVPLAAVHGLCGMLPAGKVPDLESGAFESRAVRVLETYVARGSSPGNRLHAVKAYLRRIGAAEPASPVLFGDWLAVTRLGWPERSHETGKQYPPEDVSFFQHLSQDFRDPRELAALVRVHDPLVLRILIRLDRQDPSFGRRLEEAQAAEVPGFGPAPAWRPFEEKARLWLSGTSAQRAGAALALVDLGGEESRRTIASELARETDGDLRSLLGSCLVALGDRERLEDSGADFEARLADGLQELADREVIRPDDRIRAYPGWALHDMASNLIRAGDAKVLERTVELAEKEETDLFAFALASGVPALPLWEIFDLGLDYGHVRFIPGHQEERPDVTRLRRWWSKNAPKLRYDPATRAFLVP